MTTKVKKAWGFEDIIANSKKYCGKLLILKRNFRCSLHYHKKKDETFYVIRGEVLMEFGNKKQTMKPGDSVHILPGMLHRFTGLTDAQIIEFSTQHRDSDSYRKEMSWKAALRKAYDYDGVVTKGIKPERGAPIITGRSFEELSKIDGKTKASHPIYLNPITLNQKNLRREAEWKAKMINILRIEEYYEDIPEIIVKLKKLCPKCNIVKI